MRIIFCAIACLFALAVISVPRGSPSFVKHMFDQAYLSGHLFGLFDKPRMVAYGKVTPVTVRPSNGSIAHVQGWVDRKTFQEKYLGTEPVIFKGAATQENGFDLECLWKYGSMSEAFEKELGDHKVRIFRDQYDDASADFMTFAEYQSLVARKIANESAATPYPRAFPISHFKNCNSIVPVETYESYHSAWSFIPHTEGVKQVVAFMSLLGGTNTKLHFDVGDSFFTGVYGRKRWLFVDPQYATELKIYGEKMNTFYVAGYDVFREHVPSHIPIREAILEPGDVLYFPSMTLHGVQNLDPVTMGIDEIRVDLPSAFRRHWLCTLQSVLNPKVAYRSIMKLLSTGKLDGAEIYFDEFRKKALNPQNDL